MLPAYLMLTTKKNASGRLPLVSGCVCFLVLLSGCTPPGPKALLEGERLIQERKFEEAVESLKTATDLLPQNAQAWNHLGLALHGAGKATEARKSYLQALNLNSDLAAARYNLGYLLLEQGDSAGAAREFATFTLLKPDNIDGWQQRGRAEFKSKRTADAIVSLQRAVKLYPNQPENWNLLGLAELQRGRPLEAAAHFQTALKYQRNYAPALLNLGIASQFYLGGRSKDGRAAAVQYYKEYLVAAPTSAERSAVTEALRQLEAELAPPVATNATPVVVAANSGPVAATNAVPSAVTTLQRPVTAVVSAPVVAPTNSVSRTAATTIAVASAPPVKPAVEPAKKTSVPVAVETPSIPAQPTVAAGVPAKSNPPPISVVTSVTPPAEKKGFFQRINPINLFREKSKPPTPLPAKVTKPTSQQLATPGPSESSPPPKPAPVAAPVAAPVPISNTPAAAPAVQYVVIARYRYQNPVVAQGGDRDRALQQVREGAVLHQRRQLVEASKLYREAVRSDPSLFEARYNLALVALESGAVDEALSEGEVALALNPSSGSARYNFALALEAGGYSRDAAQELERILTAEPSSSRTHLALANTYAQKLFDFPKARTHYLRVLQLEPSNPRANDIRYWLAAHP